MAGLKAYLAEDFVFQADPPIGADAFVGVLQIVKNAFPDNKMHLAVDSIEGNQAALIYNNSGTHTGDLNLSLLGGPVVPPTGKTFKLPEGIFDYTVEDGKIKSVTPRPNPGGWIPRVALAIGH